MRKESALNFFVVEIVEVDVLPAVEKVVSSRTHNCANIFNFRNLIIVELVPAALVLSISSVVSA